MNGTKYLKCSCVKCQGHIEFPVEAIGSVVECPHCGAQTTLVIEDAKSEGSSRAGKIWLLAGVAICLLALIAMRVGLSYTQKKFQQTRAVHPAPAPATNALPPIVASTPPAQPSKPAKSVSDLKVGAITLEKTPNSSLVYAVGSMTNTSDLQRFGVRIELELRNAGGMPIDTARDYISVLEPHHAWTFRALVLKPGATEAKVKSIKEDE